MNARDAVLTAASVRIARIFDVRAACDRCGPNAFLLVLQDVVDVAYSLTDVEAERRLSMLDARLATIHIQHDARSELSRAVMAYREAVKDWAEKVELMTRERRNLWQG